MFCHANEIFNFHSVIAIASRKKSISWSQRKSENNQRKWKGKLSVKEIVTKFNVEKTEGYDILKGKSELSDKIVAEVQSN